MAASNRIALLLNGDRGMNPNRQKVQRVLRDLGLLTLTESARYMASVVRLYSKNRAFVAANPNFRVPPKALAFDAYSAPDWSFYKESGEETGTFLASLASDNLPRNSLIRVLEWGCGPARVIRHLLAKFSSNSEIYGSDYNSESIAWCTENIPGIHFVTNNLQPPLAFEAGWFDFVYSISVFTHLAEETSHRWAAELFRITRPGGVLVITTNGDSRQESMLPDELEAYRTAGIVSRDKFEEGKKMFAAFHSPRYLRENMFRAFEVLQHVPGGFPYTSQDYWVLRKPSSGA